MAKQETQLELFLWTIGLCGLGLISWSMVQLAGAQLPLSFFLLTALVVVASIASSSIRLSEKTGITYGIGAEIALAAIPHFGIEGAILLIVVQNISLWLWKSGGDVEWHKSIRQLVFNSGMHIISIACAGVILLALRQIWATNLLSQTAVWPFAALTDEAVNLSLLSIVLRLQHGSDFKVFDFLAGQRRQIQISILLMTFGAGLLSYAIFQFDWIGIAIFFLPVLLSFYAFRLYVEMMHGQMDELENQVAARTADLQKQTDLLASQTEELSIYAAELEDINQQKDTYLAVLTHDMKTPLANMRLSAELIEEDEALSPGSLKLIRLLMRSQTVLSGMVENILDIEKLRAGEQLTGHQSLYDLTEITAETVDLLRPEAEERKLTLTFDHPQTPIMALVDPRQMERVLLNLISNALKYSPAGESIRVSLIEEGSEIVLTVADNGLGIPLNQLDQIFEKFHRVESLEHKAIGTGLGLNITRALVAQHNGSIGVQSLEGKGSTFVVKLPSVVSAGDPALDDLRSWMKKKNYPFGQGPSGDTSFEERN